jgi:UDP-glucose 4-epimerase
VGLKVVGKSIGDPLKYYDLNVGAGKGIAVLELARNFEKISGVSIKL